MISLAFVYLNGVEAFYDSLPQAYINRIFQRVNDTLRSQLRGNDIVGRWSKIQFAILLPSTDSQSARSRMERIHGVLNERVTLEHDDETALLLDARIGIADRQGGETFSVFVEQAQSALEIATLSDEKVNIYKVRPFG